MTESLGLEGTSGNHLVQSPPKAGSPRAGHTETKHEQNTYYTIVFLQWVRHCASIKLVKGKNPFLRKREIQ